MILSRTDLFPSEVYILDLSDDQDSQWSPSGSIIGTVGLVNRFNRLKFNFNKSRSIRSRFVTARMLVSTVWTATRLEKQKTITAYPRHTLRPR